MAAKVTPAKLREQAQQLLEQAKKEEEKRQLLIGKHVSGMIEKQFRGFDPETFKEQVGQIWADGKLKRQPKKDKLKVAS